MPSTYPQCMFYEIPGVDLHFASGMEGNVPVNTQCKLQTHRYQNYMGMTRTKFDSNKQVRNAVQDNRHPF
ncbi:MAG: hypothetical protein WC799_09780 [Desulfobacteraceae bacterium]